MDKRIGTINRKMRLPKSWLPILGLGHVQSTKKGKRGYRREASKLRTRDEVYDERP